MSIRIDSVLQRDSEHRLGSEGYLTILRVGTPGYPVDVRVGHGTDPAAAIRAERLALLCRKGRSVQIVGTSLMPRTDHDVRACVLFGVTALSIDGVPETLR